MRRNRDFHKEVRVVYRALRRIYGTEKTQDECLKIFKVVFPEKMRVMQSEKENEVIGYETVSALNQIFASWNPKSGGALERIIGYTTAVFDLPFDYPKDVLIKFFDDITPVAMRIRKLTPRETGRLMGLSDSEIDTMFNAGLSNSAMYRLHGNSIVVDVLYHIFRKMFIDREPDMVKGEVTQLSLF